MPGAYTKNAHSISTASGGGGRLTWHTGTYLWSWIYHRNAVKTLFSTPAGTLAPYIHIVPPEYFHMSLNFFKKGHE